MAQFIAKQFLAAVAKGETSDELLASMVDSVLGSDDVRLALEVSEGGPHAWRRAIELAGLIIRGPAATTSASGAEASSAADAPTAKRRTR